MMRDMDVSLSELIGKTLVRVETDADLVLFETTEGEIYRLTHIQDCCESVYLEDVCGNVADLVGSPIVMSDEVDSEPPARDSGEYVPDSETWTFYKFATVKGYVTMRFYGSSNGYYSERVDFVKSVNR